MNDACKIILCLSCVRTKDFIKAYMQNLTLSEKYEPTLLSRLCLMGPALGQHWKQVYLWQRSQIFLQSFFPQVLSTLKLSFASWSFPPFQHTHTHTHTHPPTHRHTPTTSLFHINSSLSKCLCPLPSLHGPARL